MSVDNLTFYYYYPFIFIFTLIILFIFDTKLSFHSFFKSFIMIIIIKFYISSIIYALIFLINLFIMINLSVITMIILNFYILIHVYYLLLFNDPNRIVIFSLNSISIHIIYSFDLIFLQVILFSHFPILIYNSFFIIPLIFFYILKFIIVNFE
jgi:hypothetical protein